MQRGLAMVKTLGLEEHPDVGMLWLYLGEVAAANGLVEQAVPHQERGCGMLAGGYGEGYVMVTACRARIASLGSAMTP